MKVSVKVLSIVTVVILIHCLTGLFLTLYHHQGMNLITEKSNTRRLLTSLAHNISDLNQLSGAAKEPAQTSLSSSLKKAPKSVMNPTQNKFPSQC